MKASKKKHATPRRKPPPPPKMVIRRNGPPPALAMEPVIRVAAPAPAAQRIRNAAPAKQPRRAIKARIKGIGSTHVAAHVGAGLLGNILGVVAVGKQWIGPKVSAGILFGTGAAATAAGWYWDADHVMAAGTGIAAAGANSLASQISVDIYEAAEKKAKEKKAKREKEEKEARIEEARKLVAEEAAKQQQRNGPAFRVIELVREDQDDDADAGDEEEDEESDATAEADDDQDEAAA